MINVDELFEKRYGGKTARQYFEENEYFTPIEMINFAKHCIEQLNKPAVMQAEGSDGVSGAAVGNSADGKGVSDGCKHDPYYFMDELLCSKCSARIR